MIPASYCLCYNDLEPQTSSSRRYYIYWPKKGEQYEVEALVDWEMRAFTHLPTNTASRILSLIINLSLSWYSSFQRADISFVTSRKSHTKFIEASRVIDVEEEEDDAKCWRSILMKWIEREYIGISDFRGRLVRKRGVKAATVLTEDDREALSKKS